MVPVGAVGIALTATVIGAPLGIPILLLAGKWIAAPIQQHPNFRIPTQQEQLIARQRREGSYVEDQYMNTSSTYPTPTNWMDEL
jgi:hypothetical protein